MSSKSLIFRRKIYDEMLRWKRERNGETALLIKGARRVGKSTIAEEFAKREYDSYIAIDFADVKDSVCESVKHISDRDDFFMRLQFIFYVKLYERRSVIILASNSIRIKTEFSAKKRSPE